MLPIEGEASFADQVAFLVLNGERIPGEMTIVGEVSILLGQGEPRSCFIETCAGKMIVDESWTDLTALPTTLDYVLELLQRRVKSPQPQWALAFTDNQQWE